MGNFTKLRIAFLPKESKELVEYYLKEIEKLENIIELILYLNEF